MNSDRKHNARKAKIRMAVSSLVAFAFYFLWAYWANSGADIAIEVTIRSALVQGTYSGLVTLIFTWLLERSMMVVANRFGDRPWLTPLFPITLQSVFVIGVNIINDTPNLWLTVAPSILFSAIYGYIYVYLVAVNTKRAN